jgi:hypothetical protein
MAHELVHCFSYATPTLLPNLPAGTFSKNIMANPRVFPISSLNHAQREVLLTSPFLVPRPVWQGGESTEQGGSDPARP